MAQDAAPAEELRLQFRERLWLAGVLALTLLTFLSTFTFGWVYDDPPQIPGNAALRWERLGFLFTHHLWASAPGIGDARFYRPFLSLWFLVNKTIFGLNPHWFHLTTILAHLAATALVFFIALRCLRDTGGALFATAVFGMHPLQTESVSWVSAVNDSLAAFFCFASFLAYKKACSARQHEWFWWAMSGIAFVFALLTKEVSAVLPAILLINLWLSSNSGSGPREKTRAGAIIVALCGVLGISWLLLRRHVLGLVAAATTSTSWSAAILTAPKIALFQLFRAVLPIGLSPHYDFRLADPGIKLQSLLPLIAFTVLLLVAILAARKARHLWATYAWLLLPLLPSLNPRWLNEGDFVHDRYMYMSMLGVALLAGAAFVALRRRWPENRLIPGLAVALVVGLAFTSAIQSQYWANDVSLFSRAVQIAPENAWAQLNYGAALSAKNRHTEAAPHFVRSYELRENWYAADYAGFAYQNSGDLSQAEHWFALALQQNSSLADAWFGLGQIRLAQQRPADAVVYFQKAISLHPDADGYHYALGSALEQVRQASAALDAYQTELRLHPYQTGARKAMERLGSQR